MARFDFRSPGAAFTDRTADVLTQRKAEERQMLLDQLTMNADARAQEAAMRQAEAHKSDLETDVLNRAGMKQGQERELVDFLSRGMSAGDDPGQHLELFQKYNRAKQLPTPQVGTETTFSGTGDATMDPSTPMTEQAPTQPAAPKFGYVGTEKERERERLRGQNATLIANLMSNPKTAETGAFLSQMMQANDGAIPTDVAAQYLAPATPVMMLDEPSGSMKQVGTAPANAKVVTRGYGPQHYYQPPPPQYVGTDPNNPNMQNFMDRQGRVFGAPGVRGAAAGNSALGSLGLPAGYLEDIDIAEQALGMDPRAADPQAIENYRGKMGRAFQVAKMNVSPNVRQLARESLYDAQAAVTRMEQMLGAGQLTEKDVNDFIMMTSAIPDHAKTILRDNPYNPNAQQPSWYQFWK